MTDLPRKALSIRQPWAWLICNGYKHIENRDWKTSYRGPVAIHAGKKLDLSAHEDVIAGIHPVTGDRDLQGIDYPPVFGRPVSTGGIVGVAEITDCVSASNSPYFVGKFGFVIRNAKPIEFMPVGGKLGFFEWRPRIEGSASTALDDGSTPAPRCRRANIVIHPTEPYADGILFDDLHGLPDKLSNFLAARGVVYCTDLRANGKRYAGNIVASSWKEAEKIAFSRGLGEIVTGRLAEVGTL